jgi:ribosomal protein S18 acetylase RimI-like enzyme
VDGKDKLLQNRKPEEIEKVLEGLWQRGEPGDPAAIEVIREANPGVPDPAFLSAPEGIRLAVALGEGDAEEARRLLAPEYWWEGSPAERIPPVQRASAAWVGARDRDGRLAAMARATSDGWTAWIYDVVVAPELRGRGLGKRIVKLVLDHPAVRRAQSVWLRTRDAQGLYAKYGFTDAALKKRWPEASDMVRGRPH